MLVDSKQKMLQSGEIIAIDATNSKQQQQQPVQLAKAAFAKMLTYPGAKALRYGNTMFVAMISQQNPNSAILFIANADVAPNVPINFMRLFDDLKKNGVAQIATVANEPEIIVALQQLSQKFSINMRQDQQDSYKVTITLGAPQAPGLAMGA
jgi:hypothetical protein